MKSVGARIDSALDVLPFSRHSSSLVLILFYEGGVGSMKAKRKTRKQNETFGIFENQQQMSQ